MSKPVIILAFSNDQDSYLNMVVRERKNIYKTLQNHHDKDYLQVEKAEHTSIEDLFDIFNRYNDRAAIFHYGGHAGNNYLQLERGAGESQSANAQGLAQLFGTAKNLELVFLNGCATKGQVELLLAAGVKAVIATSVEINDTKATEFAEQFYRALANQADIKSAFEIAKAFIATKYNNSLEIGQHRGLKLQRSTSPQDAMPWGLYTNDSANLSWTLPTLAHNKIIVRGSSYAGKTIKLNTKFIQQLFQEIAKFSDEVAYLLETAKKNKRMDIRLVRQAIVDSFPAPIGEQLRKLFSDNKISVDRLRQLVRTYDITVQLLTYTMLSQLWDTKFSDKKLKIEEEYLVDFNGFFALSSNNYQTFDFLVLMEAITHIFQKHSIPPFIEEFSDFRELIHEGSELYKAHLFMMEMKSELAAGRVPASEIESFCLQAEEQLTTIMKTCSFLVKYKLVTVKNIEIIKDRHSEPLFKHNNVMLDRVTAGVLDDAINYSTFTDNQSVILLKNIDDISDFLNLTPFVIDENALTGDEKSKLFFYTYQDSEGRYIYQFIDNEEDTLSISTVLYPKIHDQMEEFQAVIFDKELPQATPELVLEEDSDEDDFILFD